MAFRQKEKRAVEPAFLFGTELLPSVFSREVSRLPFLPVWPT